MLMLFFFFSLIWGVFYFSRGLCKGSVKGWSSLDSSCFSIETVSGGITNLCEFLLPGSCTLVVLYKFLTYSPERLSHML